MGVQVTLASDESLLYPTRPAGRYRFMLQAALVIPWYLVVMENATVLGPTLRGREVSWLDVSLLVRRYSLFLKGLSLPLLVTGHNNIH